MKKMIISLIPLLFINHLHAEEKSDSLQNGIYYIQDNVNPQKNDNNEFILSYRPESTDEVFFKVNDSTTTIYYYQSDYKWIVGRAESHYDTKAKSIIVKNIVESEHTPNARTTIKIGDNFTGKKVTQKNNEIIPISEITNDGFVISCDKYVKKNKIIAFDFPENYIISPEGSYCNRAYNDNGELTHIEIKVKKLK